jgi:hypothetical protein
VSLGCASIRERGLMSLLMTRRPSRAASTAVVPRPPKGP